VDFENETGPDRPSGPVVHLKPATIFYWRGLMGNLDMMALTALGMFLSLV
jgi:hypothetical protein